MITLDDKRAALKSVLESRTFMRCDQLKHFLRYVCEMEFGGRSAEISEYGIGIDALGRPKEFSPQEDSTVRSRAYSLRQKLQEYYQLENPQAGIRIDLPKGTYTPQFARVSPEMVATDAQFAGTPAPPNVQRSQGGRLFPLALGVALSSLVWLMILLGRPVVQSEVTIDPILAEAWGPLVSADANVAVCLSSPPHLHLRAIPGDKAARSHSNPPLLHAPPEVKTFFESFRLSPPGTPVYMWRTNNSMLMGDVLAATLAVRTLAQAGASMEVMPEKMAGVAVLRGRNVMRFGSPEDTRGVAFSLSKAPFSVRFDPSTNDYVISDKPIGEPGAKIFHVSRSTGRSFGLLTVMPTANTGGAQRTVVASGITSAGTHAAMEFFCSPQHLQDLKRRFAAEGLRTFPAAYQVVLRTVAENSISMEVAYAAHLVIER